MFQKFEINGVHSTVDPVLRKYINKKIGNLDKYIPKHARDSAHVEVFIKEGKTKNNNSCTCEVTLFLPKQTLIINETSINMYAAIDITEAKLKLQLKKYKELHNSAKIRRHLMGRFSRKSA